MKNNKLKLLIIGVLIFSPFLVFAHQPRITEDGKIDVVNPEISKAYYGELKGGPHIYTINGRYPKN